MASYTQGDTYPPLRGTAKDESGNLLDLSTASALQVILKGKTATITGVPVALTPPETDADGVTKYNWKYVWAAADTSVADTYECALKVTWNSATTPPEVEYFPSSGVGPSVIIKAKLA